MKPGRITHAIALLLSSISSLFAHPAPSKTEPAKTKFNKKSDKLSEGLSLDPISFSPRTFLAPPPAWVRDSESAADGSLLSGCRSLKASAS